MKFKKKKKSKEKKVKQEKSFTVMDIISGEFLLKDFIMSNIPYIAFIGLLGLLLISKGYYAKQLNREIRQSQELLDAVTTDYVELKAKLEEETMRSNLLESLKENGLIETTDPVKVIRIEKKNEKKE